MAKSTYILLRIRPLVDSSIVIIKDLFILIILFEDSSSGF